jgi:hypothetical protein
LRIKSKLQSCLLLPILLMVGCHGAQVQHDVTADLGGNDPDVQLDFWHTLADRPLTSNQDALHGMLLYLDNKDDCADYAARVALLKQRKILPGDFNKPANAAVERGTVAVMFVKTLKLHGGWAMHVFGPTPRYAVRELIYLSIFPYCSPQQTFSGLEFVGVIGALEDYQNKNTPDHPSQPNPTMPANGA